MNSNPAKGKAPYLNHLKGEINSADQAICAKCYECMYEYKDGKIDCKLLDCPLYPWMPYRKSKKNTEKKKDLSPNQMKLPFLK